MNETKEEIKKKAQKLFNFFESSDRESVRINLDASLKEKKIALAEAITNTPFKLIILKNIHYILKENYKQIRSIPYLNQKEKKVYDEFMEDPELYMRFFDEILLKEFKENQSLKEEE
jgi:hypothetical protein